MEDPDDLSFLADVPAEPVSDKTLPTVDVTVEVVAEMLHDRGYRFIPDAELPAMKRALLPFMVTT